MFSPTTFELKLLWIHLKGLSKFGGIPSTCRFEQRAGTWGRAVILEASTTEPVFAPRTEPMRAHSYYFCVLGSLMRGRWAVLKGATCSRRHGSHTRHFSIHARQKNKSVRPSFPGERSEAYQHAKPPFLAQESRSWSNEASPRAHRRARRRRFALWGIRLACEGSMAGGVVRWLEGRGRRTHEVHTHRDGRRAPASVWERHRRKAAPPLALWVSNRVGVCPWRPPPRSVGGGWGGGMVAAVVAWSDRGGVVRSWRRVVVVARSSAPPCQRGGRTFAHEPWPRRSRGAEASAGAAIPIAKFVPPHAATAMKLGRARDPSGSERLPRARGHAHTMVVEHWGRGSGG